MKNLFTSILLIFTFCISTYAQKNLKVENITWTFTDSKMTITFDLPKSNNIKQTYDLLVKIDLGNQLIIPTKGITGINKRTAGNQLEIIWYYPSSGKTKRELDIPELNVFIEIVGQDQHSPHPPLPTVLVPAVVTAVGLGTVVYGILLESEAKDLYKIYKDNKVDSPTRDEQYNTADDKHITAQYVSIGGGLIIAGGIYLWIKKSKKRKSAKSKRFSLTPTFDDNIYLGSNVGIGIQYSF